METKLTIIDQVQEVITKSGVAFEIDITELFSLAERGRAIKDVNDPNFAIVKKEMQQKRKYVTEYFKDARSEFNRMRDGIIEVQNLVLAEFTPEEDRLIALDKAEKERVLREARLESLPIRMGRLADIGDQIGIDTFEQIEEYNELILSMADADFELYFAQRIAAKAEADRLAAEQKLAEERAAFEAEKAELARKQAEADRIEAARQEERERAEKALQLAKEEAEQREKEAKERQEAYEKQLKEEAEQREKDLKAAAEKAEADRIAAEKKRAADLRWQTFLKDNNFNEETDIIKPIDLNGKTGIYRLVATYEN